jgi:putative ABC transport system ATP-binding protein
MLRIQGLTKAFNPGTANVVCALRELDLYLPAGQFAVLIGSNGAGKTTLFNVIAGVFPPSRGSIQINGTDVTGWPEYRRASVLGRVFQDPLLGTSASMTIAENLTLALLRNERFNLRQGVTEKRRNEYVGILSPLGLGLEERLDEPVSLLSGGQRQALTLLMASLGGPKLILLDEHTAALDPATVQVILDITVKTIEENQLTTLMITHNMQQALDYGDRTLMMDEGRIILDLDQEQKAKMSVMDLVDKFGEVRKKPLLEDELLLNV